MNESNKFKYGMIFLVLGVLLVVWAWGSWTLRIAPEPTTTPTYDSSTIEDEIENKETDEASALKGSINVPIKPLDKNSINAWRYSLFLLLALFLVALFGLYFLIRIARRYRARTDHDRAPPTHFEDVWSSHKMPKE